MLTLSIQFQILFPSILRGITSEVDVVDGVNTARLYLLTKSDERLAGVVYLAFTTGWGSDVYVNVYVDRMPRNLSQSVTTRP